MRVIFYIVLLSTLLFAEVGKVSALKGKASVVRNTYVYPLTLGYVLKEKDLIKTEKNTKVQLKFKDNTVITVGANSRFSIEEYFFDEQEPKKTKAKFGAVKGVFRSITGKIGKVAPERFKLKTKTATIGIRGTTLIADQDKIACIDGAITVTSSGITVDVPAGQVTQTPFGLPPTPPQVFQGGMFSLADTKATIKQESMELAPKIEEQPAQQESPAQSSTQAEAQEDTVTANNEESVSTENTQEFFEEQSAEEVTALEPTSQPEVQSVEAPQSTEEQAVETQELTLAADLEETVQTIAEGPPPPVYNLTGRQLATLINTDGAKTTNQYNATLKSSNITLNRNLDTLTISEFISKRNQLNSVMAINSIANSPTAGGQKNSSVIALDNNDFIAVWHDSSLNSIRAQKFDSTGNTIGGAFEISSSANSTGSVSASSLDNGSFVVTWSHYSVGEYNLQAAVFSSSGTAIRSTFEVASSVMNQTDATVTTLTDGKYVITWTTDSGVAPYDEDIMAIVYNSDGSTYGGGRFSVNGTDEGIQANSKTIALNDGKFIIAWSSNDSGDNRAFANVYNADLSIVRSDIEFNDSSTSNISATPIGTDKFILTWNEAGVNGEEVYARIYYNTGFPVDNEFMINEYISGDQKYSDIIDLGNDHFIIAWEDSSKGDIRAKIYNSDGSVKINEFIINSDIPVSNTEPSIVALNANNFIVTWTGDTDIYSQIFYINEEDELLSGSLALGSLDAPLLGAYNGHSNIGSMPFGRTINSTTYNGAYQIESDNTGEFLVGSANETWSIDGENHTYLDLFYAGAPVKTENIKSNSIYKYNLYKSLYTKTTISLSQSAMLDSTTLGDFYFNTTTNSMTLLRGEPIDEMGATYYESYYVNSAGEISGKRLLVSGLDTSEEYSQSLHVEGNLYGTEAQGLGITREGISYTDIGEISQDGVAIKNRVDTAYLDTVTENIPSTGSVTLTGSTNTPENLTAGLSITMNRETGAVDTTIATAAIYDFAGNGTPSAGDAYYISDDQFGVVLDSGMITETETTNYVANTGWLISIPDTVDGSGNLIEDTDNESSWGYWTAKTHNAATGTPTRYIDPHSTWVAGVNTADGIVQTYINDAVHTNMSFSGHMLGAVRTLADGTIDPIKLDNNNYINLNFDLGGGSGNFDGTAGFNTINGAAWSATFTNGTANAFTFSAGTPEISGAGGGETLTGGSLSGAYYGTGEIKSVGGTFNLMSTTKEASGVFKANKN